MEETLKSEVKDEPVEQEILFFADEACSSSKGIGLLERGLSAELESSSNALFEPILEEMPKDEMDNEKIRPIVHDEASPFEMDQREYNKESKMYLVDWIKHGAILSEDGSLEKCVLCGKLFRAAEFLKHRKQYHPVLYARLAPFRCTHCYRAVFYVEAELKSHLQECMKSLPNQQREEERAAWSNLSKMRRQVQCPVCAAAYPEEPPVYFVSMFELSRHLTAVHNTTEPYFLCTGCNQKFLTAFELKDHLIYTYRTRYGTSEIACSNTAAVLGLSEPEGVKLRTFPSYEATQWQAEKGEEGQGLSMEVDGSEPPRREATHGVTTNALGPFRCSYCRKVIQGNEEGVIAHLKSCKRAVERRKISATLWNMRRPVSCPRCVLTSGPTKRFASMFALSSHLSIEHCTRVPYFTCTGCSERFFTATALRHHLISAYRMSGGGDVYRCKNTAAVMDHDVDDVPALPSREVSHDEASSQSEACPSTRAVSEGTAEGGRRGNREASEESRSIEGTSSPPLSEGASSTVAVLPAVNYDAVHCESGKDKGGAEPMANRSGMPKENRRKQIWPSEKSKGLAKKGRREANLNIDESNDEPRIIEWQLLSSVQDQTLPPIPAVEKKPVKAPKPKKIREPIPEDQLRRSGRARASRDSFSPEGDRYRWQVKIKDEEETAPKEKQPKSIPASTGPMISTFLKSLEAEQSRCGRQRSVARACSPFHTADRRSYASVRYGEERQLPNIRLRQWARDYRRRMKEARKMRAKQTGGNHQTEIVQLTKPSTSSTPPIKLPYLRPKSNIRPVVRWTGCNYVSSQSASSLSSRQRYLQMIKRKGISKAKGRVVSGSKSDASVQDGVNEKPDLPRIPRRKDLTRHRDRKPPPWVRAFERARRLEAKRRKMEELAKKNALSAEQLEAPQPEGPS